VTDRGFCFLDAQDGQAYFAHRSAFTGDQFDHLRPGDEVEMEPDAPGAKGPRARTVRVITAAAS
jgi:cold shock CspA family protein